MKTPPLFSSRPEPVPLEVASRLRDWVRAVLDLPADDIVTVNQLSCRDSSCAPVETVLGVLRPRAPLSRTIPMRADKLCADDVLRAFEAQPRPRSI
jgi:hypothetical protein